MSTLYKTLAISVLLVFLGLFAGKKTLEEERNKAFLMDFMNKILVEGTIDNETISHYLHPDFQQFVDSKISNYDDFIVHMKNLHSRGLKDMKIHFEHIIAKDNNVLTVHYPSATLPNGETLKVKVIALFGFKDGKIILCDELTHLLKGDASMRNIGSD